MEKKASVSLNSKKMVRILEKTHVDVNNQALLTTGFLSLSLSHTHTHV